MTFSSLRGATAALVASVAMIGGAATAHAQSGADVEFGILTCSLSSSSTAIVYTESVFDCVFDAAQGPDQSYRGVIKKFGLDLKFTTDSTLVWAVLAPSYDAGPDALAGNYIGVAAEAALGAGAGARVLTGGFEDSFSLQPVALSDETGLGVSAGVETFELTHLGPQS